MLTTMAIVAKRENIPWGKTRGRVEKHMHPAAAAHRHAGGRPVDAVGAAGGQARADGDVAHTCPVMRTLHPDVKVETRFHYCDAAEDRGPRARRDHHRTSRTRIAGLAPRREWASQDNVSTEE